MISLVQNICLVLLRGKHCRKTHHMHTDDDALVLRPPPHWLALIAHSSDSYGEGYMDELEASFSCQTDFPLSVSVLAPSLCQVSGRSYHPRSHPLPAWGRVWIEMTLGKSPTALRFSLPCLPVKRRSNTTAYRGYRMALVFSVCLAWPWSLVTQTTHNCHIKSQASWHLIKYNLHGWGPGLPQHFGKRARSARLHRQIVNLLAVNCVLRNYPYTSGELTRPLGELVKYGGPVNGTSTFEPSFWEIKNYPILLYFKVCS